MRVPSSIEQISARRVGRDVYVTLTVPSQNIDQFTPADVSRIEVFGYTGRAAPPRPRFAELGTVIATVPVAPPQTAASSGDAPARDSTEAVPNAPAQGTQITIRDTLTPEELVQGRLPNVEPGTRNVEPGTGTPDANPEPGSGNVERRLPPLRRFYTAFAFSPRGRPGPPGAVADFPLLGLPDAPPSVSVTYTERAATVTWEPAGGLIGFLLERPLPEEPLPLELEQLLGTIDPAPAAPGSPPQPEEGGPVLYNVYRTTPPDPFAPPIEAVAPVAWSEQPPAPVNPTPIPTFEFTDTLEFGRERCYTVRGVRGTGPDARVGLSSPATCVTPVDTFPPATPQGLATVASEGVISLIWEPNTDDDLGGYIVLRGEAADATLQPLTLTPISEAAFRDTSVTPGTRYVYAVIAVDNHFPVPNVSVASAPEAETAR